LTAKQGKIKSEQTDKSISENKNKNTEENFYALPISQFHQYVASTMMWRNSATSRISDCVSAEVLTLFFFA
jgi:hypothetical protein